MRTLVTHGKTPSGHPFMLTHSFDIDANGAAVNESRRLEWLPFNGVGSIGIPLHLHCPCGQLYYELTRYGKATEETAGVCFLT